MIDIPIKKYRFKRAFKALKRSLVPRSALIGKVVRQWRSKDRQEWPPLARGDETGLQRYEYSWLSQNGEDGIIRHLFDEIGYESRCFVEFGFGASQCNALRLMLHEQFRGLMIDGSAEQCEFFNQAANALQIPGVKAVQAFIDRDNLESLIADHGISGEIDFLSIDVNGNDYWFWEVLNSISPRVVCIEYNSGLGPDWSCSIPYSADFERYCAHPSGFFAGASLPALESLGRSKNYRLVGCDATGTNAFFLRNDIDVPRIPTLAGKAAYRPHANWLGRGISEANQLEIMRCLPYVDIRKC